MAFALKKIRFLFLFFPLVLLCLNSCSDDNPVKPTTSLPADTSRYNWDTAIFYQHPFSIGYVDDSEGVYFMDSPFIFYYKDNVLTYHNTQDPDFYITCGAGYGNEFVIFGGGFYNASNLDPKFKIFKNGTYQSYVIQGDGGGYVSDMISDMPNSCWFSTTNSNHIYHFDGGTIIQYSLDTLQIMGQFFIDKYGQFYLFSRKVLNPEPDFILEVSYFRLTNDSFVKIGADTTHFQDSSIVLHPEMFRCGEDMLRVGNNSLYYFNGSTWTKWCNTPGFYVVTLSGKSKEDFVTMKEGYELHPVSYMNHSWANEYRWINYYFYGVAEVYVKGAKVYAVTHSGDPVAATFYLKGTPK